MGGASREQVDPRKTAQVETYDECDRSANDGSDVSMPDFSPRSHVAPTLRPACISGVLLRIRRPEPKCCIPPLPYGRVRGEAVTFTQRDRWGALSRPLRVPMHVECWMTAPDHLRICATMIAPSAGPHAKIICTYVDRSK